MSIIASGWSHESVLVECGKHRNNPNPVSRIIKECLTADPAQFGTCLDWFSKQYLNRNGVLFMISHRTTSSYLIQDIVGRVEPYDSLLTRMTEEYANEVSDALESIFRKYQTRDKLQQVYEHGCPELEDITKRCAEFDMMAYNLRKSACDAIKANDAERQAQYFRSQYPPRNSGCLIPIILGIVVLCAALS